MEPKKQIFWDFYPDKKEPALRRWKDELRMKMGGSRMYRDGDYIILEELVFDSEDDRAYDYYGKFKVEYYRKALQELQKVGKESCIEIEGVDGAGNKAKLRFTLITLEGKEKIKISLDCTETHRAPGGREILYTPTFCRNLNNLLLQEMKKVLYEDRTLEPDIGTEIYQEGDKVIFSHCSPLDEEGHRTSFGAEISIDVYKKGIDDLLKTGKCIMRESPKIEGFLGEMLNLERFGKNLQIEFVGKGFLSLSDFDFNKLVL